MTVDSGTRFLIQRSDLTQTRFAPDPDAPAARPLAGGEMRVAIDHFALTANNLTYASFGQAMNYWQFFPAPDPAWGCLPVWGFADVTESRADGVDIGSRIWGYLPAGTHAVLQPGRLSARGFADSSAHRQALATVYNQYSFCNADPGWHPRTEGLQALLQPLFITSFLIDDFLADEHFFGARQVVLSSASSKTALGTAFCLALRRGVRHAPTVVGLTSQANLDFTRSLGCYDDVLPYDGLHALDAAIPTAYIDFAGNAALRRSVHGHFVDSLTHSSAIGATHWQALSEMASGGPLPGPRPTLFFAPAQIKRRSGPAPEGWGPGGLQQRLAVAWTAFMRLVDKPDGWLQVVSRPGPQALAEAYQDLLAGRSNPRQGVMAALGAAGPRPA